MNSVRSRNGPERRPSLRCSSGFLSSMTTRMPLKLWESSCALSDMIPELLLVAGKHWKLRACFGHRWYFLTSECLEWMVTKLPGNYDSRLDSNVPDLSHSAVMVATKTS